MTVKEGGVEDYGFEKVDIEGDGVKEGEPLRPKCQL